MDFRISVRKEGSSQYIEDDELEDFRTLAKSYATRNVQQIARLLEDKDLKEICHGNEKQVQERCV